MPFILVLLTMAQISLGNWGTTAQQADKTIPLRTDVETERGFRVLTECINSYEASPIPDPKLTFQCTHRVQASNGPVEVTGSLTPVGYTPQGAIQLECHEEGDTQASCKTWYAITSPSAQEYGACGTTWVSNGRETQEEEACELINTRKYPKRVIYGRQRN